VDNKKCFVTEIADKYFTLKDIPKRKFSIRFFVAETFTDEFLIGMDFLEQKIQLLI
jgi:hypothetical protein